MSFQHLFASYVVVEIINTQLKRRGGGEEEDASRDTYHEWMKSRKHLLENAGKREKTEIPPNSSEVEIPVTTATVTPNKWKHEAAESDSYHYNNINNNNNSNNNYKKID